jgi:hypothetical protein
MTDNGGYDMDLLWTIVAVVLLLWLFGFLFGALGGLIHVLLVIAVVVIIFRLLTGRTVIGGN